MSESADTRIDRTSREDPPTIEAPQFFAPGKPIETEALHLRGLPTSGQQIGDFHLLRTLGTGGFARVFLARQLSLGRLVALKASIHRGQEARTLAPLEHDHIVRVFSESVEPQRNLHLLCMQYVPGTTLERIIGALHRLPLEQRDGKAILAVVDEQANDPAALDLAALRDRQLLGELDFLEAGCWFGARLAEALDYAHARGVFHRDVKPANILINRYGRPLLVDFNVATAGDKSGGETFGGTLAYMSPEHLDAYNPQDLTPDSAVDARSDIYSLGLLLYELFTGKLPFDDPAEGDPLATGLRKMADCRRAGTPLISKTVPVPAALERVIARCLASRPEDRFQNAAELAAALDSCRELLRVRRDLPPGRWLTRIATRHPFLMAVVLVSLPHILGSITNISYNTLRIKLTEPQATAFFYLIPLYNLIVYPLCVGFYLRQWLLVYRVWQQLSRPSPIDQAVVDDARRRALRLPIWGIVLACAGWLPGSIVFPLAIDLCTGWSVEWSVYLRFLFSFTVSGLIALTYSVIAIQFIVVRILYPGLWLDARRIRTLAAEELGREEGRLKILQFLAVLIPLSGASLLLGVGPREFDLAGEGYFGFRLLVTGLMATGTLGLALAILAAGELRQTIDSLTRERRP